MSTKRITIGMSSQVLSEVDRYKSKTRSAFIVTAIEEKLARLRHEERIESLGFLVDEEGMDITNWQPLQRKAMADASR